jgi:hypothetical protein
MDNGRIRFWQGFSLALALVLFAFAGDSLYSVLAQSGQKQRFTELPVERINIIEGDVPIAVEI